MSAEPVTPEPEPPAPLSSRGPLVLDPGLRAWLEGPGVLGRRVASVEVLPGGHSNETFAVTADDGRRYALRRFVGSNTCAVEEALLHRLAGVVPIAPVVAADPDGGLSGAPTLLSELVAGRDLGAVLPTLTAGEAAACGRDVGVGLARLGGLEFDAPGFFSGRDLVPGPPGAEPTQELPAWTARCLDASGPAREVLGPEACAALLRLTEFLAPQLAKLAGQRRLVHADFNPKNLLVVERGGRWVLAAVLDWEFAFSSSPLFDVGNLLRRTRPPGFEDGFLAGFAGAGGDLPPDWRVLSTGLDLFSIADLLTRPPEHRYFAQAVTAVRELLAGHGPARVS